MSDKPNRLQLLSKKAPVYLYAPTEFWRTPLRTIELATGGCGAGRLGDIFVPDTLYGLSIFYCCRIHDWMYLKGEELHEKERADRVFLNNMLRTVDKHTNSRVLKWLRQRRAIKYYTAVDLLGASAFWESTRDAPNEKMRP